MMILKVFERLLNIDDIDCKWCVRIMFLLSVVIRCAAFLNPYSDTDFTWLNSWMASFEAGDAQAASTIPFSSGNIVFLCTALFALFFTFLMGVLYSALYVRSFRKKLKERDNDETIKRDDPAPAGQLAKRFLILSLFYLAVSLPFALVSSNLLLFFLIGFPFVFTAPACYLSGDKGMFQSLAYVAKITRGFYLAHIRSLFLIVLVFLFTDAIAGLVSYVSMTTFYILSAAFSAWNTMAIGRYAGMAYCAMREAYEHTVVKS